MDEEWQFVTRLAGVFDDEAAGDAAQLAAVLKTLVEASRAAVVMVLGAYAAAGIEAGAPPPLPELKDLLAVRRRSLAALRVLSEADVARFKSPPRLLELAGADALGCLPAAQVSALRDLSQGDNLAGLYRVHRDGRLLLEACEPLPAKQKTRIFGVDLLRGHGVVGFLKGNPSSLVAGLAAEKVAVHGIELALETDERDYVVRRWYEHPNQSVRAVCVCEGGFGYVLRGVLERDGARREVAVKVKKAATDSKDYLAAELKNMEMLRREAALAADGLQDRFLEVLAHGRDWMCTPWIQTTLSQCLQAHRLPNIWCFHVFKQLAEVVELFERLNFMHRDLKPSNVLVRNPADQHPSIVVIDLGCSKAVTSLPCTVFRAPADYAAPELTRDGVEQTTKIDVYALGGIAEDLLRRMPGVAQPAERELLRKWKLKHANPQHRPTARLILDKHPWILRLSQEAEDLANARAKQQARSSSPTPHSPPAAAAAAAAATAAAAADAPRDAPSAAAPPPLQGASDDESAWDEAAGLPEWQCATELIPQAPNKAPLLDAALIAFEYVGSKSADAGVRLFDKASTWSLSSILSPSSRSS
ncbi:Serine/threonine-protein kinases drp72 [Diplonema papillatum]|nr:Serine/threonine-protein kinases drp72 [Diplonema papillatum]